MRTPDSTMGESINVFPVGPLGSAHWQDNGNFLNILQQIY